MVHTKFGELVRTSSPGCSARTSEKVLSPRKGLETGAEADEGVAAPFSLGGDAILGTWWCWRLPHGGWKMAVDGGEMAEGKGGGNDIVTGGPSV